MSDRIVFREAKSVRLVHLEESDAEILVRFVNNPEITQFIGRRYPITEAKEKSWLKDARESMDESPVFGIEVDNTLIGTMSLEKGDEVNRTAETGAMIGRPDYQGQGYGTSAKMLLLKYAFDELNLRIVYSRVYAFNEASQAYSQKCGYEHVATLPDKQYVKGEFVDELIFQVTHGMWRPQFEKWQKDDL